MSSPSTSWTPTLDPSNAASIGNRFRRASGARAPTSMSPSAWIASCTCGAATAARRGVSRRSQRPRSREQTRRRSGASVHGSLRAMLRRPEPVCEWRCICPLGGRARDSEGDMSDAGRPPGLDVQQCPSCGSTAVYRLSIVESGRVWLVCRRCDLRWSIADRRSPSGSEYTGFERRRLFG